MQDFLSGNQMVQINIFNNFEEISNFIFLINLLVKSIKTNSRIFLIKKIPIIIIPKFFTISI